MRPGLWLEALAARPARVVIGLISGTSADGIDAAVVRVAGAGPGAQVEVMTAATYPYPSGLRERLLSLTEDGRVPDLCALNVQVGEVFAEAALAAARESPVAPDLIGSHGQTAYYLPPADGRPGSTLQIGEPAVIAERTGLPTVADFRPRDMALGGMGAPLVPYADYVLFRHDERTRIVQNIGGIANATVLPAGGTLADVFAFDTGPGNMVIDALAEALLGQRHDFGGEVAASGTVDADLLGELMDDDYFRAAPPKGTGRERYGAPYAARVLRQAREHGLSTPDALATVTGLTVESIVTAYERFVFPRHDVDEVIVAGGGVHNRRIMEGLRDRLGDRRVLTTGDFGIPEDAKEAVAFAILANDAVMGLPTNVPGATGASRAVTLGAFYPGRVAP